MAFCFLLSKAYVLGDYLKHLKWTCHISHSFSSKNPHLLNLLPLPCTNPFLSHCKSCCSLHIEDGFQILECLRLPIFLSSMPCLFPKISAPQSSVQLWVLYYFLCKGIYHCVHFKNYKVFIRTVCFHHSTLRPHLDRFSNASWMFPSSLLTAPLFFSPLNKKHGL